MDTLTAVTQRPRQFLAGMPQLGFSGLSENWLLKECGDIHWMHLAHAYAMTQPDFLEQDAGTRAYAAFTRVRLSACHFDQLQENDNFHIASGLTPAGRSQYVSRHACRHLGGLAGGHTLAQVDMLSAFVHRQQVGSNRSVARARLRATEHWHAGPDSPSPEHVAAFAMQAREQRKQAADRDSSLLVDGAHDGTSAESGTFTWRDRPHPELDFNGAGFLYFANFAALIDRAEWHALHLDTPLTLVSRDLFFYGNVDVGETLVIHGRHCVRYADGSLSHHCLVVRERDQRLIAEVFTRKRLPLPGTQTR